MPREPKTLAELSREDRINLHVVACLRAKGGRFESQKEIAQEMGVGEGKVSKLMQWARRFGVYEERYRASISVEEQHEVNVRLIEPCLLDCLQKIEKCDGEEPHLRAVKIVRSPTGDECTETTGEAYDTKRIPWLAQSAGPYVAELLRHANPPKEDSAGVFRVGLSWGKTLAETLEFVASHPNWRQRPCSTQCVATTGELVEVENPGRNLSSSSLAEWLAEAADSCSAATLRAVPALISMKVEHDAVTSIIEWVKERNANYRKVLDEKDGVASNLDAILTSIGSMEQTGKIWKKESEEGGIPEKFLRKLAGDIGGVFVKKTDLLRRIEEQRKEHDEVNKAEEWTKEDEDLLQEVRRRWLGITDKHYLACAKKANPGVIVVALGAEKAKTAIACAEKGLVNELVIDLDLARAICKLINGVVDRACTLTKCPFADIKAVNDADFGKLVLRSAVPVLVVFHDENAGRFPSLVASLALFACYARNKNVSVDIVQVSVDDGHFKDSWAPDYATAIQTSLQRQGYALVLFKDGDDTECYAGVDDAGGKKELNDWLAEVASVLGNLQ